MTAKLEGRLSWQQQTGSCRLQRRCGGTSVKYFKRLCEASFSDLLTSGQSLRVPWWQSRMLLTDMPADGYHRSESQALLQRGLNKKKNLKIKHVKSRRATHRPDTQINGGLFIFGKNPYPHLSIYLFIFSYWPAVWRDLLFYVPRLHLRQRHGTNRQRRAEKGMENARYGDQTVHCTAAPFTHAQQWCFYQESLWSRNMWDQKCQHCP